MSDLTKEELLEWLRCLYVEGIETIQAKDDIDHEEAHDQLVKIVEGHFKYKYLDNDPECYHVADQEQVDELVEDIILIAEYEGVEHDSKCRQIKQLLTRQPVQVDEDTKNVIDNLVGLQECLEAGEDWCSVAVVAGAIELLLSQKRTVTWEWVRNRVHNMPTRSASHTIGTFVSMLEELGIEVVE